MILKDLDLVALCVYCEAWTEPDDGKAAVARVIYNRMARKYESDGTVVGTVLKYDQFSWAWFAYVNGKYVRISDNLAQAKAVAEFKLKHVSNVAISRCAQISLAVKTGSYVGPQYLEMTNDTVLYLNPHIIETLPSWATPDKLVCTIGNQNFYRA